MRIYRVAVPDARKGWSKSNLVTFTEAIRMINAWKKMGYEKVKLIDVTLETQ